MTRFAKLLDRVAARGDAACLVLRGRTVSATELTARVRAWSSLLGAAGVAPGSVAGLEADFGVESIALHLALLSRGCVSVLQPPGDPDRRRALQDLGARFRWRARASGEVAGEPLGEAAEPDLVRGLRERGGAGFVVFSSGSTGPPRAVLHDADRFLARAEGGGENLRTLALPGFETVAGQDTLFSGLWRGGELVLARNRDAREVAALVEELRVEALPASPTFLDRLCTPEVHGGRDLSSVRLVACGGEPVSPETLERIARELPDAELVQEYRVSELGCVRARSKGRDDLRARLDGLDTKVVDGVLWVRSGNAMLGYLDAPSPFDADGWWCTDDPVEQDGEWIRFVGRRSDVIHVGDEKVFPREVESVIHEIDGIDDVLVRGAHDPLTGEAVEAIVRLKAAREEREVRRLVRSHCRERLPSYKVPVKVLVTHEPLSVERGKQVPRKPEAVEPAADAGSA